MRRFAVSVLTTVMMWACPAAATPPLEKVIVYIECSGPGGTNAGTGVLVGRNGLVVTALHVANPTKYNSCKGTIGYANPGQGDPLVFQAQANGGKDAALLQFTKPGPYEDYLKFCKLEDWMVRREIFVGGFPGGDAERVASYRKGVLATTFRKKGMIETDGQTVEGMSGGPVYANDLKAFIGIIAGAQGAMTGGIDYYGIIPADEFAAEFGLTQSADPCFRRSREVEFPNGGGSWEAGNLPLKLGVKTEDGVCFLAAVWGEMTDPGDSVAVTIDNGEYVLGGKNTVGGHHGATARCIWNN
ncbi:serine protease [Ensifer sp. NPDC090286]|uniref:S1 family peptidase n=1 Tax=Ensifer sp. NPDC090286 TaxID=3363991 RepID=UPI00383A242E